MADDPENVGRHLKAYWGYAALCCAIALCSFGFVWVAMFGMSRDVASFLAIPLYFVTMTLAALAAGLALWNTVLDRPKPYARTKSQFRVLNWLGILGMLVASPLFGYVLL